ncbi:MAG: PAS domain S-box protein, partial [Desulfonatronovibrio sp.]
MPDNLHRSNLAVNFGKRLRYLRQMKKMTQYELGDKVGLSRRQIGRIENGESSPQFSLLEKLCQAFDTNIIQLFLFQEECGPNQEKMTARVDTQNHISNNFLIQPSLIGLWSISNTTGEMSWTQGIYEFLGYSRYSVKPTLIRFLKRVDTRDKQLLINFFDTIHSPSHPQKILIRLATRKSRERTALVLKEPSGPEEDIQMVILDVTEVQEMHNQLLLNTEQLEKTVRINNIKLTRAVAELKHELHVRRQTEQRLRESEESFRTLAEKCPVSIFRFDRQGRVNFVNDWHINQFTSNKLEKKHFLNKSVHELPGLVKAGKDDEVARIFKGEYVEIDEVFFPEFAAGSSGWVSIRAVPIYKKGVVAGGILLRENITKHKQRENKLLEYKTALEQSGEGIALAGMDGYVRFVNDAWAKMHGYAPDELTGRHLSVFHTSEQMEREVLPNLQRLMTRGRDQSELGHVRKDGSTFTTHMTTSIVKGKDGQPLGLVGVARDITKEIQWRKQTQFNNRFRKLMTELSARFVQIVDTKTFNDAVDYTLASLGQLLEVDRSYLLRFSQDLSIMSNTHEWSAPGAAPQIHRIQHFPTNNMPWFMSWMFELRPMNIPDVSALPDEAARERKEFQFQNIKSLLCLPIYDEHKKLLGFMGFDVVRSHHNWSEEQITMLQMLAEILGSVIVRLEAMRSLAINKKKLQKVNAEKDKLFAIIAH